MITCIRKGMINVSPIGRACSQTERDAFEQHDKTANVRPKMVEHLKVSPKVRYQFEASVRQIP